MGDELMLHPRTLELRDRIFARRDVLIVRQKAEQLSGGQQEQLADFVHGERNAHNEDMHQVKETEHLQREVMQRAVQHMEIQDAVRRMTRDISRSSQLSRSHIEIATTLENRIEKMRAQLDVQSSKGKAKSAGPSNIFADREVDNALVQRVTKMPQPEVDVDDTEDGEKHQVSRSHGLPPQPPRQPCITRTASNHVFFSWQRPVMDGGFAVFEYEVAYDLVVMVPDKKLAKLLHRTLVPQRTMGTSRWYLREPVAHDGFDIDGLTAGTTYANLRVRCRNEIGWSDWITGSPEFTTATADPPSTPLFIKLEKLTTAAFTLVWDPPLDDGGVPIKEYEIRFIAIVKKQMVAEGKNKQTKEEKEFCIRTSLSHPRFKVRELPGDTEVKQLTIAAVNESDLVGPAVPFNEPIRTHPPPYRQLLMDELQRAQESTGEFIDSDFYNAYTQREYRPAYIERLFTDLEAQPPEEADYDEDDQVQDAAEAQREARVALEAQRQAQLMKERAEMEAKKAQLAKLYDKTMPNHSTRRSQYLARIKAMEDHIEDLSERAINCMADSQSVVREMNEWQKRIKELEGERDRVEAFVGTFVNSGVLHHGAVQRFDKQRLLRDLGSELERLQNAITTGKRGIIDRENLKRTLEAERARTEETLKLRKAAFNTFESDAKKVRALGDKVAFVESDRLQECWGKWRSFLEARDELRQSIMRPLVAMSLRKMRQYMQKWRHGKVLISEDNTVVSRGGFLLRHAQNARNDIQSKVEIILAELQQSKQVMERSNLTHNQRQTIESNPHYELTSLGQRASGVGQFRNHYNEEAKRKQREVDEMYNVPYMRKFVKPKWTASALGSKSGSGVRMPFLFQGDGFFANGMYDQAVTAYENQTISLRSEPVVDVKALAITHGRMGRVYMVRDLYEYALMNFDRQRSLASEIGDQVEFADAYQGLGEGYMERGDHDEAIRCFEQATIKYNLVGDRRKEAGANMGLYEVYSRLHNQSRANVYKARADRVLNEVQDKITGIYEHLQEFRDRLLSEATEKEKEVDLERISANCIRLRHERDKLEEQDEVEQRHLEEQEEATERVRKRLKDIVLELDMAQRTDDSVMISHTLVEGGQSTYEVEELKLRLAQLVDEVEDQLEEEQAVEQTMKTKLSNHRMRMSEIDEDLKVEEGSLMRRVQESKLIRCVALNPANVAGNDVTGGASGGVELFAASEGPNIHVFDIHHGDLELVFEGDDRGRHIKNPTGHTTAVTALYCYGFYVYSGGLDATVQGWSIETESRVLLCEGHEAGITALHVDEQRIFSGSADTTMRIWNRHTGVPLRIVSGHEKAVRALTMSGTGTIASGGGEGEIRVWDLSERSKHSTVATERCMLANHTAPVTALALSVLELVSGDATGLMLVVWLETQTVLRRLELHKSAITALQFDATKIMSASVDCRARVTDVLSGEPISTMADANKQVLAMAFDTERIMTVAADNKVRYYKWSTGRAQEDKIHVLQPKETLVAVAKRYRLTIQEIMAWNGITAPKSVYVGMRLIVKKADPNQPTEAEQRVIDRERRQRGADAGLGFGPHIELEQSIKPYNKVQRMVTGVGERGTMGRRLFDTDMQHTDLFQPPIETKRMKYSLAGRMHANGIWNDPLPFEAAPYYFTPDNRDEWEHVAHEIGGAMLDLFIEFTVFDLVIEIQRKEGDPTRLGKRLGTVIEMPHHQRQSSILDSVEDADAHELEAEATARSLVADPSAVKMRRSSMSRGFQRQLEAARTAAEHIDAESAKEGEEQGAAQWAEEAKGHETKEEKEAKAETKEEAPEDGKVDGVVERSENNEERERMVEGTEDHGHGGDSDTRSAGAAHVTGSTAAGGAPTAAAELEHIPQRRVTFAARTSLPPISNTGASSKTAPTSGRSGSGAVGGGGPQSTPSESASAAVSADDEVDALLRLPALPPQRAPSHDPPASSGDDRL